MEKFKRLLCLALCLGMMFAIVACGEKEEPAQEENNQQEELTEDEAFKLEPAYGTEIVVRMGDACTSGPFVAMEKGFFEEQGIKVIGYKGEASDVESIGTGTAVLTVGHIAKQLVPATNGVDLVFVGGAHSGCKTLFVLGDSPYQTVEDLKGKKISVPNGIGASDYNITARLLDGSGINPLTDVELTPVEVSACVPAMENGDIAAALLSDNWAYKMVQEGKLRPIRSMLDEDLDHICCAITMNGTFVKENPIHAKRMVAAVKKAHVWMYNNPEECTKLLMDMGLESYDEETNLVYNKSLQFGPSDAFAEAQLRKICEDYLRLGLCTTKDDADTIMSKVWQPQVPDAPDNNNGIKH